MVLDGTFQSFLNQFQKQWYWMDSCEHFSLLRTSFRGSSTGWIVVSISVICEPGSEAVILDG